MLFFEVATRGTVLCDIVGTKRKPAWYRNNTPVSTGQGYTVTDRELKIEQVSFMNTGWYTCAAANEYGRTEKDYLIIVGGKACLVEFF